MYVVIAKICDKDKLLGFRLIDNHTLECTDVTIAEAEKLMADGCEFSNLYRNSNGWSTKPTSLSLFPIVNIESKTKDNWTLIKYFEDYTYYCADRTGKLHTLTHSQFLQKVSEARICNVPRKLVQRMIFNTELL